ncbi:arylsulfatase [Variovorax sp. WS11]|uniref:arylsulfatase n=1 Tax=Variovorax sp. WS11 TaxID=1105204 RepID=UPI000D0CDC86|nr:arylsulfatase [Variovorax sp. WS11]NDZ17012.1 arylsulfatase [Variovorax sp. WS11]PSL81378.1 arylsulfatase [Variovorax sp. WS11]
MDYDTHFEGTIGTTYKDSTPWSPQPAEAPKDAPDVIFIVLDDVGFSDIGCYGSEIETPNFDRLAKSGAQYTNFHVTSMCSPTRACMLTGRNAHAVGMGAIAEWAGGYPSYRGHISKRAATLPENLREYAYSTMAVGKWHLTPMKEITAAGPFTNWPQGRGFDHWYGFQGALTDQWNPELFRDSHPVDLTPNPDYHLTSDLVDQSIAMIRDHRVASASRPYFMYLAFGACHFPHHVPAEVIAKYKGRYAKGWDAIREERVARQRALGVVPENTVLPERNPGVQAWADVPAEDRRFLERSQEVYAAFLDHTDQQIGRLFTYLESSGRMDNTIIVLISDNGASPEGGQLGSMSLNMRKAIYNGPETPEQREASLEKLGGPYTFPHYAAGWAQVSNTPLKWYKMNTYGGGVRAPLLVHWPRGIRTPGVRRQYHHVIDLFPTMLDVLGVPPLAMHQGSEQVPVHGTSLRYTFSEPDAPTRKVTQHFELNGDRAIWHRGWKAVTLHRQGTDFNDDRWALYDLEHDFSECHDLAQEHPQRLREMVDLWWSEARAFEVLPLDDRKWGRLPPEAPQARTRVFEYHAGQARIDRLNAPDLSGRSYAIGAEVTVPAGCAEGVLLAFGTALAGYTLYVKDARVVHEYVFSEFEKYVVTSNVDLAPGRRALRYEFARRGGGSGGVGRLMIDGAVVGTVPVERTWPHRAVQSGLTCGRDTGLPVGLAYEAPFAFTGEIASVVVEVSPDGQADPSFAGRAAEIEQ